MWRHCQLMAGSRTKMLLWCGLRDWWPVCGAVPSWHRRIIIHVCTWCLVHSTPCISRSPLTASTHSVTIEFAVCRWHLVPIWSFFLLTALCSNGFRLTILSVFSSVTTKGLCFLALAITLIQSAGTKMSLLKRLFFSTRPKSWLFGRKVWPDSKNLWLT